MVVYFGFFQIVNCDFVVLLRDFAQIGAENRKERFVYLYVLLGRCGFLSKYW